MRYVLFFSLVVNILLVFLLFRQNPIEEKPPQLVELKEEVPDKPISIVMLGNSITYAGDWPVLLNRDDVLNGGKPGWTTEQISWVIKNFVTPNKPKLTFFKGGINDLTLGIPVPRIVRNIKMNLDSIRNVGSIPVFQTTLYQYGNTDRNRRIDSINHQLLMYCEEKGYEYVDLRPALCRDGDLIKAYVQDDNTHLKPEAYPIWAKVLGPMLEKYGL